MELREWAIHILSADTLEGKLFDPGVFSDKTPGPAIFWDQPTRPLGMGFSLMKKEEKLPSFQEHDDPYKRAVCLHRFAGHELLAVEIMAYTILAFPDAPSNFRRGLAHTLREEQEHVRLYNNEMRRFGLKFGDIPLYKHFWRHTPFIKNPKDYVSLMSLTFEMANLDFAPMYGKSFARFGDLESAALMNKIVEDEISHVRFGWNWFNKFKSPLENEWDQWNETLKVASITPKRAKGFLLNVEHRLRAGIPNSWIEKLKLYKNVQSF